MKALVGSKLTTIFLLILIGILWLFSSSHTHASHWMYGHIYSMHSRYIDEWICVDAAESTLSDSTVKSRVQDSLQGNSYADWDHLAPEGSSYRINFNFRSQWCRNGGTNGTPIRVYAKDAGACGGYSCVLSYSAGNYHNGTWDYGYQNVILKTSHINEPTNTTFWYRHTINHEFSHVLGLSDPTWGDCQSSIAHSGPAYGCTALEWPTSGDRSSVTNLSWTYTTPP